MKVLSLRRRILRRQYRIVSVRPVTLVCLAAVIGCSAHEPRLTRVSTPKHLFKLSNTQQSIVDGARDQLTWGTGYDPAYRRIGYPNGDVPRSAGVCTDVVIRALRHAGYDLQELIHHDMSRHWSDYPHIGGLDAPDPNIDHRRVPVQVAFFKRHGKVLTMDLAKVNEWQPGDIVAWKILGRYEHVGILSDSADSRGLPFAIHNMGWGPREEDALMAADWKITGHYRFPAQHVRR